MRPAAMCWEPVRRGRREERCPAGGRKKHQSQKLAIQRVLPRRGGGGGSGRSGGFAWSRCLRRGRQQRACEVWLRSIVRRTLSLGTGNFLVACWGGNAPRLVGETGGANWGSGSLTPAQLALSGRARSNMRQFGPASSVSAG